MMHFPCFYINYWIICWPSRSCHTLSIVIIKSVIVVVRLGHKLPTVEKWWKLFLNIQHKQNCYCKHHEELTFTQFVLLHSHCIEAETILFLSKASISPRIVLVPIVPDPFFWSISRIFAKIVGNLRALSSTRLSFWWKIWRHRLSPPRVGYRKSDWLLFFNMFKKSSRSKTVVLVVRGSPEGPITKKDSSGTIWYRSGRLEKNNPW